MSPYDATTGADQTAARTEVEAHDKHIAGLRARAALAGYELHVVSAADGTGAFWVSRWGRSRELRDAAEVERFLQQVGAP